jgi:ABC-type nickel/cobalt efflux system permease component RcnA
MTAVSLDSLLALGFLLGLRHAMEADHLAAISTIVTERRSLLSASFVGAFWGLGHTLALLIAGVGVLLLRVQLTDRMAHVFELGVGVMLIFLGADVLRTLTRRGASHTHEHTAVAPHSHADGWRVSRPLLVGMVHGLAGSAPLLVLTLTVMSSPVAAFSYIAVFGVGSIMGMTIMSVLVSVPARLTVQFARTNLALRGLSGLFSVGLGLFIVYENAVVNRLVALMKVP